MRARIVFDLDGTLIDSAPQIHHIASEILAGEGLAPLTLAQIRSFIGNGVGVLVTRIREARGIPDRDHARLLAELNARYVEDLQLAVVYPGVIPALDALRAAGHRLGICTNKPIRPCHAVLAHCGLAPRFSTVIGGDSLAVRKPDPAPLCAAFAALDDGSMTGEPMIYVGDSEVDAETAQRADVPFLLYSGGYLKTTLDAVPHRATFARFDQLPGLVTELGGALA